MALLRTGATLKGRSPAVLFSFSCPNVADAPLLLLPERAKRSISGD